MFRSSRASLGKQVNVSAGPFVPSIDEAAVTWSVEIARLARELDQEGEHAVELVEVPEAGMVRLELEVELPGLFDADDRFPDFETVFFAEADIVERFVD
ncbi:hypothetical protein ONS95_012911 [Cadophora gregata]|uniref:uncharacterized protein n=1 Tax=Cadophora gregata TaxID=51156 RepID=UPI0026DABF68|nr:uncharacterized protein ONS95_012911 [Cadophora gregata]KAK0101105.1 hypothetical protein ONS96_006332 [Cadophora gregata f. sp. sojae]KAK0115863.1 hypothetical protein ONS95_012911 [Cadophora gregata]